LDLRAFTTFSDSLRHDGLLPNFLPLYLAVRWELWRLLTQMNTWVLPLFQAIAV